RKARRQIRRKAEIIDRSSAPDSAAGSAEQKVDRIFRLFDVLLGAGNLDGRGVEELFGLVHVQPGGSAVVVTQTNQAQVLPGILGGRAPDLELQIPLAQRKIIARHIGNQ